MNRSKQTRGQVEQILSDRIEILYRQYLGDRFVSVTCHLFKATIAIVVEWSLSPVEQQLASMGKENSLTLFRWELQKSLRRCIREFIEEMFNMTVVDLLADTNQKTGRTGLIVVLERTPRLRL